MKYCLSILFVLLVCVGFSQPSAEGEIRKLLNRQTEAWNLGDIDSFMHGYWQNDSLLFVGKNGITYGYQNTLNNYKKNYANSDQMGKLQFTVLHINKLSGTCYQVIGKWHLFRSIGDAGGYFTLIFKNIREHWVIISDHSS